mmetsp:Transcript_27454/g.82408  ORF Transcript_27454/g.82408 Transcript_27454/m.82408 type:complete len:208 (+) Transcript_27454:645-1268(+)
MKSSLRSSSRTRAPPPILPPSGRATPRAPRKISPTSGRATPRPTRPRSAATKGTRSSSTSPTTATRTRTSKCAARSACPRPKRAPTSECASSARKTGRPAPPPRGSTTRAARTTIAMASTTIATAWRGAGAAETATTGTARSGPPASCAGRSSKIRRAGIRRLARKSNAAAWSSKSPTKSSCARRRSGRLGPARKFLGARRGRSSLR